MDDVTSSPSDSSTAVLNPPATTEKSFANKPRRLARGLNDLFARQSTQHKPVAPSPLTGMPGAASPIETTTTPTPAPAGTSTSASASATAAIAPGVAAPAVTHAPAIADPGSQPAFAPSKTEPAGAGNAFEYRFVQLISRLDATCNLLADARQTHLAAAQRNGRIAWGVAGTLAVVTGIALWWAGSLAAWNKSQLEYESARSAALEQNLSKLTAQHAVAAATSQTLTRQHDSLTQQHATLARQNEAVRAEIDTIRTALTRANAVIDELMSGPEQK